MKTIIDRVSILIAFEKKFPFSYNDLSSVLSEHDIAAPSEGANVIGIGNDGKQHVLGRLVKDDVEILYEENEGRITINSKVVEKVMDLTSLILNQLKKLPDADLNVKWFEFNHNIRVLSEKHPMDISWRKKKSGSAKLDEITGLKSQPYTDTIVAFGGEFPQVALNTIPEWLHFSISTFVPNPRYFNVHIVYRRTNFDEIMKLGKELPSIIELRISEL